MYVSETFPQQNHTSEIFYAQKTGEERYATRAAGLTFATKKRSERGLKCVLRNRRPKFPIKPISLL
jgi:hypothetical protein